MSGLAALLLLLVSSTAALVGAGHVSSVMLTSDRITITVPVEVVGGSERLIGEWYAGIERAWNRGDDGEPFVVCGRVVEFDVQFAARPIPEASASHVVFVEAVPAGQRYVSSVWNAFGTSPANSPRTGYWGSNLAPGIAAHEFGHLLGLMDEYTEHDANGNGRRDPGEGSVPDVARYPDAWQSLMADEGGVVLERHIREVLRLHGAAHALSCLRPASER